MSAAACGCRARPSCPRNRRVQPERLDEQIFRYTAPSGVRVLAEVLPTVRSVAIGIWVRTASVHETSATMGVSHLLEHLVFKGTERRSAQDLALALEARGGSLDAYTSRDHTSFQAHVLDDDLPIAVDVLTDLVRRPLLRADDFQLERQVVLEEIHGVLDTPDDLVFDLQARALWPEHPYGFPILGTPDSVGALTVAHLQDLHQAWYGRENCVIAAAGNFDPEQLVAMLRTEGWWEANGRKVIPRPPLALAGPAERGQAHHEHRETTQTHIVLGTDTVVARDPRRYALAIVVNLLGGGMSSRLFQRVREELGLAYAIYAFQHLYQAAGQFGVYVGTQPSTADQAVDVIREELASLATSGLTNEALASGKRQLMGQLMLSFESPGSRMHRMASLELQQDSYRPLSAVLADIDAVSSEEVHHVAAEFLDPDRQTVVRLGP